MTSLDRFLDSHGAILCGRCLDVDVVLANRVDDGLLLPGRDFQIRLLPLTALQGRKEATLGVAADTAVPNTARQGPPAEPGAVY